MKKLILYRHAKSSWDDPLLPDHQRPLALRGLRDAPYMAQKLKKKGIFPDFILSSDAARAKATALITAENLRFPKEKIEFTPGLYHASGRSILSIIRNTDNKHGTLFLFGHNPGLNAVTGLLGGSIDNLPTCGQFGFTFNSENWSGISSENTRIWFFDYPKNKAG